MKKYYKHMKVFDCQDMPLEVKQVFLEKSGKGNGCYVNRYVYDERKPVELVDPDKCSYKKYLKLVPYNKDNVITDEIDNGVRYVREKGDDIISDWLYENGGDIYEEVIIKHWW